jgi:hypothetical protein
MRRARILPSFLPPAGCADQPTVPAPRPAAPPAATASFGLIADSSSGGGFRRAVPPPNTP